MMIKNHNHTTIMYSTNNNKNCGISATPYTCSDGYSRMRYSL